MTRLSVSGQRLDKLERNGAMGRVINRRKMNDANITAIDDG